MGGGGKQKQFFSWTLLMLGRIRTPTLTPPSWADGLSLPTGCHFDFTAPPADWIIEHPSLRLQPHAHHPRKKTQISELKIEWPPVLISCLPRHTAFPLASVAAYLHVLNAPAFFYPFKSILNLSPMELVKWKSQVGKCKLKGRMGE